MELMKVSKIEGFKRVAGTFTNRASLQREKAVLTHHHI